jgi:pSer/pThr/pTyr-binding forkhead associated (FHA) protein
LAAATEVPAARVLVTPVPLPRRVPGVATPTAVAAARATIPGGGGPAGGPVIEFSTGARLVVVGTGVVGRKPDGEGYTHVVRFEDPEGTVSRNHFAFGLTDGGLLWVQDMGSRNGTYLVGAEGSYPVPAGGRVTVGDGSGLMFGTFGATIRWNG